MSVNLLLPDTLETRHSASTLRIGGVTPLTTIDFPNELAAVVFTQGCNLRCQYCQNSHLIPARSEYRVSWDDVMAFLQKRTGLLDAVIFSGGEPTLQKALPSAIKAVKAMGFKVGVHTSGTAPARLADIISDLDWVGFDIKALPEDYPETTGCDLGAACWESLDRLLSSDIPYEVRTTVHWQLLPPNKLLDLAYKLRHRGVQHFALQNCLTRNCLNEQLPASFLDNSLKQPLLEQLAELFPYFEVR